MTRASLLHVLDHSTALGPHEVRELEQLAQAFPYCQTAHLLLAKAAHDQGAMLAGQRLRRAATYAADRALLRRLIEAVPPVAIAPEAADEVPVAEMTPEPAPPQPARFVVQRPPLPTILAAEAIDATNAGGTVPAAEVPVTAGLPDDAAASAVAVAAVWPEGAAEAATTAATALPPEGNGVEIEESVSVGPNATALVLPTPAAPLARVAAGHPVATGWSVSSSATVVVPAQRPALPPDNDEAQATDGLVASPNPENTGFKELALAPTTGHTRGDVLAESGNLAGAAGDLVAATLASELDSTVELTVEPTIITAATSTTADASATPDATTIPANDEPAPTSGPDPTTGPALLLEANAETAVAATEAETAPPAENQPLAPPVRPPADAGAARFEYGLADALAPTPAYLLPGLTDEWTWTLPPKPYVPPALTPAAFLGDDTVGYGWGESSRLGLALSALKLDDEVVGGASATFALPLPGDFFAPDALVQQHWATHRPTAPPPPTSLELIETFLRQKPRLSRPAFAKTTSEAPTDLAAPSTQAVPELVSESLARILARQGKLARAIEVYERLMVKHPEKMAYFATEIQSLQLQQPPLP